MLVSGVSSMVDSCTGHQEDQMYGQTSTGRVSLTSTGEEWDVLYDTEEKSIVTAYRGKENNEETPASAKRDWWRLFNFMRRRPNKRGSGIQRSRSSS